MNRHNKQQDQFETLQQEIQALETLLRSRFEQTPAPHPQVLARIKTRLRTQARTQAKRNIQLRWAGSIAAALLLAAGLSLYYRGLGEVSFLPQNPATPLQAAADPGLDDFTASLPAVLNDDPAMQQLGSELKDLESQTSNSWNTGPAPTERPSPSARQTNDLSTDRSLAWQPANGTDLEQWSNG